MQADLQHQGLSDAQHHCVIFELACLAAICSINTSGTAVQHAEVAPLCFETHRVAPPS